MPRDVIVPDSAKAAYKNFHFASAVRSNGLLLCSGVIGTNADGSIPENPADEFRNAWRGIGNVLAEAGLSYENIQEFTSYHVNMHDHLGIFMKVRDEFLNEPWPAWTAIGTTDLAMPGARVEIRVIAE